MTSAVGGTATKTAAAMEAAGPMEVAATVGTATGADGDGFARAVKPLVVKIAISSLQLFSTYWASCLRSFTTNFFAFSRAALAFLPPSKAAVMAFE